MPQAAPAPPPATAASAPGKPKGAVGIWIGVLLIIGGIILGIVLVVAGARSLINGFDDLERVPIDGGGIVRIEDPGTQTIYAERPSSQGGSSFSTNTFSGFGPNVAVRVIGPDGVDVPVSTGGATETYTFDGREGVSIGTFDAATDGEYRIVTRNQDGASGVGRYTTIAVGTGLELSGIGAILGGVFGGGLVVLIGIVVVIIFAVRRSRSKKRLAQGSGPYPGAYGAPVAGWPAAPGYAPPGYAAPGAPGGYGAPDAPAAGGWPPAGSTNPGWVPPPVAQPGAPDPGPTWTAPPPPPPQSSDPTTWTPPPPPSAPASDPATWTPPAPEVPPPWQPSGDAPAPDAPPSADPSAPSWDPPATSDAPPPPPPAGGDGPPAS